MTTAPRWTPTAVAAPAAGVTAGLGGPRLLLAYRVGVSIAAVPNRKGAELNGPFGST